MAGVGEKCGSGIALDELRRLPLEQRCRRILESDQISFTQAAAGLRRRGLSCAAAREETGERCIAWATAFNVEGPPAKTSKSGVPRRGIRGYCDHWPPSTPWSAVWDQLTRNSSAASDRAGEMLLLDLALSVACEQREDWQEPSSRPVNCAEAKRAFERTYGENHAKVTGFLRRLTRSPDAADAVSNEAWARVFCEFWSVAAHRRFLGLCHISTLVCQVGRHIAIDQRREQSQQELRATDLAGSDGEMPLEAVDESADPGKRIEDQELRREVEACIESLPARCRIVATMVWLKGLPARQAAEKLGISEPAVSQHLKKARELVGRSLSSRGMDLVM